MVLPLTIPKPEALSPVSLAGDLRKGDSVEVCQGQKVSLSVQNPGRLVKWYYNSVVIDSLSNREAIEVEKPGKYLVEVSNSTGCTVKDSFQLTNNLFALKADFLIPTQAFVGDTIVCLDITKPIPDMITWFIPNDFQKIASSYSNISFIPYYKGDATIKMLAIKGDCKNIVERRIKIFDRGEFFQADTVYGYQNQIIQSVMLFPNPNDGVFTIEVNLAKNIEKISFRIISNNTGESVYSKEVSIIQPTKILKHSVNLNVISGFYTLLVEVGGQKKTKKISIVNY